MVIKSSDTNDSGKAGTKNKKSTAVKSTKDKSFTTKSKKSTENNSTPELTAQNEGTASGSASTARLKSRARTMQIDFETSNYNS